MIKLNFIEHNGNQHTVEAEPGSSLMQAAVDNCIPGIDADCGGGCACGTCHVKVADHWFSQVGAATAMETSLLQMTPEMNDRSRLACQITLSQDMDGLTVELPEFQM